MEDSPSGSKAQGSPPDTDAPAEALHDAPAEALHDAPAEALHDPPTKAPPRPRKRSRLVRFAKAAAPYAAIVVVTLAMIDAMLIAMGMFPPRYRKGNLTLGFYELQKTPKGQMRTSPVPDLDETAKKYWKNEAGLASDRSMDDFVHHPTGRRVVALGDSHTDLLYAFPITHMGVLEKRLRDGGWTGAEVLGAGHGRWSPLQSLTLYEEALSPLRPEVVVLNFYTGNDFYDLIRSDDRPHLQSAPGGGYTMAPALWVEYTDPSDDPLWQKSRVLYVGHRALDSTGILNAYEKFTYARSSAAEFGVPFLESLGYITDLLKTKDDALWYNAALGAQLLNQALFFHHFHGSRDESEKRARYVLQQTHDRMRAAGDDALLVLSPIPSRVLAKPDMVDPIYDRVLARLPVTKSEVYENELHAYESLRKAAEETGWLFVDNLPELQAGPDDVYLKSDLHIAPSGSEIVGTRQSKAILAAMPPPKEGDAPRPPAGEPVLPKEAYPLKLEPDDAKVK